MFLRSGSGRFLEAIRSKRSLVIRFDLHVPTLFPPHMTMAAPHYGRPSSFPAVIDAGTLHAAEERQL